MPARPRPRHQNTLNRRGPRGSVISPAASSHSPVPHGGPYSAPAALRGRLIDFSSSITPAGPPPAAEAAMRRALGALGSYPDPASESLRAALARYAGMPSPSYVAAGNGATDLIHSFCRAFLGGDRRGRAALVPAPAFGEYEAAARLAGARVIPFRTMDMAADLGGFEAAIPRGGCAFLCNPSNPAGELLPAAAVRRLARAAASRSSLLMVDECFIELVPGADESVAPSVPRHAGLVVLRSMTKSFGLAGIRVGYALARPALASAMARAAASWSVSGPAQEVAAAALRRPSGHLEAARRIIRSESAFLRRSISAIEGFECGAGGAANFLLVRTERPSGLVRKKLMEEGVLVRDCATFRGMEEGRHIRIAVRTRADNEKLVAAMGRIWAR